MYISRSCLIQNMRLSLLVLLISFFPFSGKCLGQTLSTPNEVQTEIVVKGTPEQIWDLLIDFEQYPQWHPYLSKVSGEFKEGKYLKFTIKNQDGEEEGKFRARLIKIIPNHEISWGGNLCFFFRAKHYFYLIKIDDTHTKLVQGEYWKGVFGKKYGKKIYQDLTEKFIQMNFIVQNIIES